MHPRRLPISTPFRKPHLFQPSLIATTRSLRRSARCPATTALSHPSNAGNTHAASIPQPEQWIVGSGAGTLPSERAGWMSVVDRAFDGCVIVEHWTGQFGERGVSLTSYDAATQRWLQHYVGDNATTTDYTGIAKGSSVVFTAPGITPNVTLRMTYNFLTDGRVEQRFDTSNDGGATWKLTSDLFYARSTL